MSCSRASGFPSLPWNNKEVYEYRIRKIDLFRERQKAIQESCKNGCHYYISIVGYRKGIQIENKDLDEENKRTHQDNSVQSNFENVKPLHMITDVKARSNSSSKRESDISDDDIGYLHLYLNYLLLLLLIIVI